VRQIVALSVALVASLIGAYLTWTDETEEVTGEAVEVYAASAKDLQKVVWDSETVDVTVERRKDERGEYLWIESTETRKPRKPPPKRPDPHDHEGEDGGEDEEAPADGEDAPAESPDPAEGEPVEAETPPEPEPEPEPVVTTTRFLGNAKAEEAWAAFAPLRAPRQLDPGGADLSKFGLGDPSAEPEAEGDGTEGAEGEDGEDPHPKPIQPRKAERATIEVVRKSGPITLTVGGETYGNKHRYVQYGEGVYLIEQDTLKPLASPRGMIEQSLFPFQEADIEQVDVALPTGETYAFVQQNRDDRAKVYWARQESLDQEDGTVGTWLGKVFKLRLREYVDEAEVEGELVPVVTYTVRGKGEQWPVEIVKATTAGEDGQEQTEWYARSAYNRSLVTLTESLVRNMVDDLESLAPAPVPTP
jgi:hypothetical protein